MIVERRACGLARYLAAERKPSRHERRLRGPGRLPPAEVSKRSVVKRADDTVRRWLICCRNPSMLVP
jgi:hypothetical protein